MKRFWLGLLTLLIVLSLLVGVTPAFATIITGENVFTRTSDAWLGTWANRIELTIDKNDIDAGLANFPVLIYLSASSGRTSEDVSDVFDELANDANRKKIAVTLSDGTTQCYGEIERWVDADEEAWIWTSVANIASGSDTIIYFYYDPAQPDNDTYIGDIGDAVSENVWDADFVAVYHMADETTSTILDSTDNDNDGTKKGANEPPTCDAAIGKGQDFEQGDSDYINCGNDASLRITGGITLECWAKPETNVGYTSPVSRWEVGAAANRSYGFLLKAPAENDMSFDLDGNGAWTTQQIRSKETPITVGADVYWAGVFRAILEFPEFYKNGVDTSVGVFKEHDAVYAGTADLYLGCQENNGVRFRFYDGIVDEVRISKTDRSTAWITATYESQRDDLIAYVFEPSSVVTSDGCTGFGEHWATLTGTVVEALPPPVTQVGFDYGLTPAYGSEVTATGTWSDGNPFVLVPTDLDPACVYHARAKAFSDGVWGYGADFVFSTIGSATLYEYLNTGGDAYGADIYGVNWAYQQFTVGATSHTVNSVVLYLKRTGAPSYVTVSIYHADGADKPTGNALCSATLDGDDFSAVLQGVRFEFDETSLEATESYAIVVKAIHGDDANDIQWRWVAAGGLANAVGGHSTDSGVTWTLDTPADFLFEIWGYPALQLKGAAVFEDYLETGDLLFTVEYINTYPPYYPTEIPARYFDVQLLDTDGVTLIASTVCQAWGNRPASIYLSPDEASPLTKGNLYYLRIYGDFTGNPSDNYQLTATDWQGSNLIYLDQWVLLTAHSIEEYEESSLTTVITEGEVLNRDGGVIFANGIPALMDVRPELFQVAIRQMVYEEGEWTHGFAEADTWETQVGPEVTAILGEGGTFIGLDGKTFGALFLLALYLIVAIFVISKGHTTAGFVVALPILLLAFALRLLDVMILGAVGTLFIFIIAYQVYWKST